MIVIDDEETNETSITSAGLSVLLLGHPSCSLLTLFTLLTLSVLTIDC